MIDGSLDGLIYQPLHDRPIDRLGFQLIDRLIDLAI